MQVNTIREPNDTVVNVNRNTQTEVNDASRLLNTQSTPNFKQTFPLKLTNYFFRLCYIALGVLSIVYGVDGLNDDKTETTILPSVSVLLIVHGSIHVVSAIFNNLFVIPDKNLIRWFTALCISTFSVVWTVFEWQQMYGNKTEIKKLSDNAQILLQVNAILVTACWGLTVAFFLFVGCCKITCCLCGVKFSFETKIEQLRQ